MFSFRTIKNVDLVTKSFFSAQPKVRYSPTQIAKNSVFIMANILLSFLKHDTAKTTKKEETLQ